MVAEVGVGYYNAWLVLGPVYQNNLLHIWFVNSSSVTKNYLKSPNQSPSL